MISIHSSLKMTNPQVPRVAPLQGRCFPPKRNQKPPWRREAENCGPHTGSWATAAFQSSRLPGQCQSTWKQIAVMSVATFLHRSRWVKDICWWLLIEFHGYPLVIEHCYGKSPFFTGKPTISMSIFSSKLLVIPRGYLMCFPALGWRRFHPPPG